MNNLKYCPDSEEYTESEWEEIQRLVEDAALAEEMFSEDELEQYMKDLEKNIVS